MEVSDWGVGTAER